MPRKTAGYRYPHATTAARSHDHGMCRVIEAIADRVLAGREDWGTPHPMPPVSDEATARRLRARLFGTKRCRQIEQRYGEPMSVRCEYELTGNGYVLTVQVWPRSAGRAEIARRMKRGEPLAYNPYREK
jgi:hypothetical protein